ncbi:MAG: prephenate dehydratase domain-containing protein [Chthoniobacteraceae bacterium]|jgi:prephenate dehydratase
MSALLDHPDSDIAYLGPKGSFAHLVALQRYPDAESRNDLKPFPTVPEVFEYVDRHQDARGIVPIENSSGGMIRVTVDEIIEHAVHAACSVFIQEELSINVRLSLLGKRDREIRVIYSHGAPLHHCEEYLKQHYPYAKKVECTSTSVSAEQALDDPFGAAIAPTISAEVFGLDILESNLLSEIENVTQFFVVGRNKLDPSAGKKTSLVVALHDRPGSLVDFLLPWKNAGIDLSRIESRPIIGHPNTYRFLVEFKGTPQDAVIRSAMEEARALAKNFYDMGSYPVLPRYES